ncbi:MAG: hypothetical protein R3F65_23630 [bacterium]
MLTREQLVVGAAVALPVAAISTLLLWPKSATAASTSSPAPAPTPTTPSVLRKSVAQPPTKAVVVKGGKMLVPGQDYFPDLSAPYGPYHGTKRPAGLPAFVATGVRDGRSVRVDVPDEEAARVLLERLGAGGKVSLRPVRLASPRGAALGPLESAATATGLGETFVKAMLQFAAAEGEGGTFAVPARNFNGACGDTAHLKKRLCTGVMGERRGKDLITAWGVFNWNRDAGRFLHLLNKRVRRAVPKLPDDWMPWDWSSAEEILVPLATYVAIYDAVSSVGGSALDGVRAARLWHKSPAAFNKWAATRFSGRGWAEQPADYKATIDNHLRTAGVIA